jgi:hypothetical protein
MVNMPYRANLADVFDGKLPTTMVNHLEQISIDSLLCLLILQFAPEISELIFPQLVEVLELIKREFI